MLSLMDPIEIDGLVIYRDDEVPHRFFLMPDQPQIPLDEAGVPDFLFIKYLRDVGELADGAPVGGGYLQFRSSLQISEARRKTVVDGLRARLIEDQQAGRKPFGNAITSTEPALAHPLWTKGEVSLLTVSDKSGLATNVFNSALPDLGGDLASSFAMELTPDGSEIFWSAFNDPDKQLPLMVAYKLTYKATVSASMTIRADHTKVREQLWQIARPYVYAPMFKRWVLYPFDGALSPVALATLRARVPLVRPMVERGRVREVIQSAVTVTIRSDLGTDAAATQTREMLSKLATDLLSERVIPALFGSATPLKGADTTDGDAKTELLPLQEDALDHEAHFSFDLDQVSTIDRDINPSGSLRVIIPAAQQAVSESGCFRQLRLSDGFFKLMRVRARTAGVDFARDGIAALHVRMRYDHIDEMHPERVRVLREYDKVLRGVDDVTDWRFDLARRADGGHENRYEFQTEVQYVESIPPTKAAWVTSSDRELLITPRALGALRVEAVLAAPKTLIDGARVGLRHVTASGAELQTNLDLTAEAPRKTWFQFTGELAAQGIAGAEPEYEVVVRYKTAGGEVVMPAYTTSQKTLEVPSPFERVIRYTLSPQGFAEGVTSIAGDLVYEDSARRYRVVKSFVLDKASASTVIEVPVFADGPKDARVEARITYSNGSTVPCPSSVAKEGSSLVGATMQAMLEVQVIPLPDLDFDHDLQMIIVQLSYEGVAPTTMTFTKATLKQQTWKVPLARPDARRFSYSIRYIAYDRSRSAVVHQTDCDDPLVLLDRQAALPPSPTPAPHG